MNDTQWKIPLCLQPSAGRSWPLCLVRINFVKLQDAAKPVTYLNELHVYLTTISLHEAEFFLRI